MQTIDYQIITACKHNFPQMQIEQGLLEIKKAIADYCGCDAQYISYKDSVRFLTSLIAELNPLRNGNKMYEQIKYKIMYMDREREIAKSLAVHTYDYEWIMSILELAHTFLMMAVLDIPGYQKYLDNLTET